MFPKTKAHIPPEVEQEMTIEPPAKRFFGILVIGAALVLVSYLAGFPRLTKPETDQPLAQEAGVNKALIRRVYDEVLNTHQPAVAEALFAPDFRFQGAELLIFSATTYYAPFPGVHYTLEDLVAEGDRVVARWQASGSYQGLFGRHSPTPTDERVTWSGITIWQLADGQITEAWTSQQRPNFMYRMAFPGLQYTVEEVVVEEDRVLTLWQARSAQEGMFRRLSPTGEQLAWSGITIWRLTDGQITEAWTRQPGPTFALGGDYSEFGD